MDWKTNVKIFECRVSSDMLTQFDDGPKEAKFWRRSKIFMINLCHGRKLPLFP